MSLLRSLSPAGRSFLLFTVLAFTFSMNMARAENQCLDTSDVASRIVCEAHANEIVDENGFPVVKDITLKRFIEDEIPLNQKMRTCVTDGLLERDDSIDNVLAACIAKHKPRVVDIPHDTH